MAPAAIEPSFPLETQRLLLRVFEPDDLAALVAIYSREDVARYLYEDPRDERAIAELRWNARSRAGASSPRGTG